MRTSGYRTIFALLLFGTAFGYLEASVVTYLRDLHEPVRQRYYPGRDPGELFPLLTLDQLRVSAPQQSKTLAVELGREAATILMHAAIALAVAGNVSQWTAAFVLAFGVWDLTFYLFLKLLLDWPATFFTWDILFLVPVPWTGPVLAPALVSVAMIAGGVWHLMRDTQDEPVRIHALDWLGILGGAAVIILSFAMDYRNILAGAVPRPFHWSIFGAGLGIGCLSYVRAALARGR